MDWNTNWDEFYPSDGFGLMTLMPSAAAEVTTPPPDPELEGWSVQVSRSNRLGRKIPRTSPMA